MLKPCPCDERVSDPTTTRTHSVNTSRWLRHHLRTGSCYTGGHRTNRVFPFNPEYGLLRTRSTSTGSRGEPAAARRRCDAAIQIPHPPIILVLFSRRRRRPADRRWEINLA